MFHDTFFVDVFRQHGAVLMMTLLAARWLFSVAQLLVLAEAQRRSIPFDLLCLVAYFAGTLHYVSQPGGDAAAGVVCVINMALIFANVALALYLRKRETVFARRLAVLDGGR